MSAPKGLARYFLHPEDRAAISQLQSIPLFPEACRAFLRVFDERRAYGMAMATRLRLGPDQLPEIYELLPPICETMSIDVPHLFLEMNPVPNAFAMGDARPIITVTSGLIEHMERDELTAVLAHECGHIACRHSLYSTMVYYLVRFGSRVFGPVAQLIKPIEFALLYWSRRSELSADRAAAFVCRGPEAPTEMLLRLAAGPKDLTGRVAVDQFMAQAAAHDALMERTWDRLLQSLQVLPASHPFPAVRARELKQWCDSESFRRLMSGTSVASSGAATCSECGHTVLPGWRYCRQCGAELGQTVEQTTSDSCQEEIPDDSTLV